MMTRVTFLTAPSNKIIFWDYWKIICKKLCNSPGRVVGGGSKFKCWLAAKKNKRKLSNWHKLSRHPWLSRRLQWANNSPIFQNILVLFSPFTRGLLQKGNKMVIIWDWDELSIHQSVCLMWYTRTNGTCFLIRELFSRQEKIHFLNKNILHPRYDALKKPNELWGWYYRN